MKNIGTFFIDNLTLICFVAAIIGVGVVSIGEIGAEKHAAKRAKQIIKRTEGWS